MSENSNIFLYGKGIFTTVSIVSGGPFLWAKHWQKLITNAETIGIDLVGFSQGSVLEELRQRIAEAGISNGRARLTFADQQNAAIWPDSEPADAKTTLKIIAGENRAIPDNFTLTVSPFPVNSRSPLSGVKSCNYLENLMAVEDAKTRGFHEAVRVNDFGSVTSAAMANVFWLKGGELFTPSLATGCLAGTTREFVLERIDCREVEAGIEVLDSADAIYLTSAGLGIVPVREYNGREMLDPEHQITGLLAGR